MRYERIIAQVDVDLDGPLRLVDMGYQRARVALCDDDNCDARMVLLPPVEHHDQRLELAGWTTDFPLTFCPAHPVTRVEPIEAAIASDELLETPLNVEDLTFVSFRPATVGGDYLVRVTHQPSGIVVEATGPSALQCRAECVEAIRAQL